MADEWFVQRDTYERKIKHPESKAEATVVLRPLNAGDRAEFNEIQLLQGDDGEGTGRLQPGRMQLLTVERAVVSWTLPQPPTAETIRALDPRVFDQIYRHVSFGNPDPVEEEGGGDVVPLPAAGDDATRAAEAS